MYILLKHVRYRIKPYRTVLDRERTVLVQKSIETIEENKNIHQKFNAFLHGAVHYTLMNLSNIPLLSQ